MSVYIKGMEMPQDCYDCLLSSEFNLYDEHGYCESGTECSLLKRVIDDDSKRLDNCPIQSVPDHGRLIDADALFDFILNIYKTAQGDARKAYRDVLDTIVAAGDVIPEDEQFGNSEQLDRGGRRMSECNRCLYAHECVEHNKVGISYEYGCLNFNPFKPKSNADRIRAMTDEELAEWLCDIAGWLPMYEGKMHPILDWLKQEAID